MLGVYASALLTILASLVLGAGILRACGLEHSRWLGAGVGYAGLLVLASIAIRLPGADVTAVVILTAAVLAAGLSSPALRGRSWREPRDPVLDGVAVVVVVLALLALPFLAAGHFGPLGVSLDDDLGFHLVHLEALRAGHALAALAPLGYPLGPESLAAPLAQSAGGAEQALLGVAAAAPALTALTALTALQEVRRPLRLLAAAACGLPYLTAAYFGEASFKEPIMALLVLCFALLSARLDERRMAVALAILTLGMVSCFGAAALLWPAAIMLVRVLSLHRERGVRRLRPAALAAGAGVAAVALAWLGRHSLGSFSLQLGGSGPPGGNFVRQLPPTEGLGIWLSPDFRLSASPGWATAALVALAAITLAGSAALAARRRQWLVLAPAAACVLVYLVARVTTVPYVSAKGMVVAGPLLLLLMASAAAEARRGAVAVAGPARPRAAIAAGAIGVVCVAVLWSSAQALRGSPVDSSALADELHRLRDVVANRAVVYLGRDDWIAEELHGPRVAAPGPYRTGLSRRHVFRVPPPAAPIGFASVSSENLDRFQFAITTGSLAEGFAPANWRRVGETAHFALWERFGPTPPAQPWGASGAPGAVLDCRAPRGRAIASSRGLAGTRAAPQLAPPWQAAPGAPAPADPSTGLYFSTAGGELRTELTLPPGRWQLSLDYQSPGPVRLRVGDSAGSASAGELPERLQPAGNLWPAMSVTSSGSPLTVVLLAPRSSGLAVDRGTLAGRLEAAREGVPARQIPLAAACGRYVDWYYLR